MRSIQRIVVSFGLVTTFAVADVLVAAETVYGLPVEPFPGTTTLDNPYGVCAHLSRPPRKEKDGDGTGANWALRARQMRWMKDARIVTFDDLATLSPKDVAVLILAPSEAFPGTNFDALVAYVRDGGTIVFSSGVPLYKDIHVEGEQIGDAWDNGKRAEWEKRLHIRNLLWWSQDAKAMKAPEKPDWQRPAKGFDFDYGWDFKSWQGARYIDDANLREGDTFIPVMVSGNDLFSGAVIAAYKLNSEPKGNVIVHARNVFAHAISPATQAERVARIHLLSFAFGLDKVFWYNLEAFRRKPLDEQNERDTESNFGLIDYNFQPKPAFIAYQALTRFCPDGSTRPTLREQNGIFLADWTRPDGARAAAVWTAALPAKTALAIDGPFDAFTHLGGMAADVNLADFTATPAVTYLTGFERIGFAHANQE